MGTILVSTLLIGVLLEQLGLPYNCACRYFVMASPSLGVFLLGVVSLLENNLVCVEAQVLSTNFHSDDRIRLATDCLTQWKLDSLIFIRFVKYLSISCITKFKVSICVQ